MSGSPLTEALALRIGLAARVLPDMEPRRLVKVLVDAVGLPLTEQKLGQLTVQQLRTVAGGELAQVALPAIKQALDYLWGKAQVDMADERPPLDAYTEGDMPGSIRVAVASNGDERLDGHFGTCSRFLVYQVSPTEIRLIDVRGAAGGESADDKNTWRARLIRDCQLLYVISIGGPAAAKIVKHEIHPIKLPQGGEARGLLGELQQVLSAPPPWLAKAMGVNSRAMSGDIPA